MLKSNNNVLIHSKVQLKKTVIKVLQKNFKKDPTFVWGSSKWLA